VKAAAFVRKVISLLSELHRTTLAGSNGRGHYLVGKEIISFASP
jgi:hypothetical protein